MQPPQKLPPLANLIAGVTAAECVALADALSEWRDLDDRKVVPSRSHRRTNLKLPSNFDYKGTARSAAAAAASITGARASCKGWSCFPGSASKCSK